MDIETQVIWEIYERERAVDHFFSNAKIEFYAKLESSVNEISSGQFF